MVVEFLPLALVALPRLLALELPAEEQPTG